MCTKIAQKSHHIVVKTLYDINDEKRYENDDNFMWKNEKNDFMNFIFLTRKRFNDIENDEKMLLNVINDEKQYKQNRMMLNKRRIILKITRFRMIQRMWWQFINNLKHKIRHLRKCDMSCKKCHAFLQKINFFKKKFDNFFILTEL